MYFIILCVQVKPVTTELTENKTTLKFCKLQNTRTDWSLRNVKMTTGRFCSTHNTYENYAHYLGTTDAKIGFACATRRVNVCGNVCVDMANVWRLACVVLDDDDRQTKAFRKHWSKQLGILLACITTTFGRSGSRRSQWRNLNWTVNWTTSRTQSLKENSRSIDERPQTLLLEVATQLNFFFGVKPMDSVKLVAASYGSASVWNSTHTYSEYWRRSNERGKKRTESLSGAGMQVVR